ncbi:MAG: hypothetical protein PHI63_00435 [Patescibacteria group bacterium]|nr:hypothetical protein [Patescibacteria group bacterium]
MATQVLPTCHECGAEMHRIEGSARDGHHTWECPNCRSGRVISDRPRGVRFPRISLGALAAIVGFVIVVGYQLFRWLHG